jgi:hypothetical protein
MDIGVLWLAGPERLVGKVGEDEGDGLALRKEGDEILFAPYDSKPMKWVPVMEFVVLAEPDEDAPPEETSVEEVAESDSPFPRRRRE